MEQKQFRHRSNLLLAVFVVVLAAFIWVLYDLQINKGEEYLAQSQRKIAVTETVEAARGEILDRYGRVLVSNRLSYQVTLDTSLMGTPAERNATLLALIKVCQEQGVAWTDTLPVTQRSPFRFTSDTPFSYESTNDDGTTKKVKVAPCKCHEER